MTLNEFAIKNKLNPQELLEILIFEKFPINSIDDELDIRVAKYLSEYNSKGDSFSKKSRPNKFKSRNKRNEQEEKKHITISLEPTQISKLSKDIKKSVSEIITFFLKDKKLYSINTILSIEEIKAFAEENKIEIKENKFKNESKLKKDEDSEESIRETKNKNLVQKSPVVVVVGHVDHGKTTLLDFIRKKNVAKTEKGGITQHLGAYEINNNGKKITFIDTPGHAAFTSLRSRGIDISDIAILVISAEDGLKPQTIESIKMLKNSKSQIIVAITKIDKENTLSDDKIYQQLTENNIVVEAWGGNVPCLKISAKTGKGVSELLEIINLTAELMDLKTSEEENAFGFILESRIIKGFGSTATVILKSGKLKIGDFFGVDNIFGKVTNLIDTNGKNIKEVGPSKPFILVGFESLCNAGEILISGKKEEIKKQIEKNQESKLKSNNRSQITVEKNKIFNLIIKADVFSSLQAIKQAVEEMNNFYYKPVITSASVGNITENDIKDSIRENSLIVAFNVKKDSNISKEIDSMNYKIEYYNVIYHLIEKLKEKIEKQKDPKKIQRKIGKLNILKIFNIKGIGIIAGFRVLSGIVKSDSIVEIFRNKNKVGSGKIVSLQKERQFLKELSKGHEGAISVDGFVDWKEEDQVEVYEEVLENT